MCYCVFCKIERYIFFHTRITFAVGRVTPFRYAMTFIAVILIDREGSWLLDRFSPFSPLPFSYNPVYLFISCSIWGGYLRVHSVAVLFAIDECTHNCIILAQRIIWIAALEKYVLPEKWISIYIMHFKRICKPRYPLTIFAARVIHLQCVQNEIGTSIDIRAC